MKGIFSFGIRLILVFFIMGCAGKGTVDIPSNLSRNVVIAGKPDLLILLPQNLEAGALIAAGDLQGYLKAIAGLEFPREDIHEFDWDNLEAWDYHNLLLVGTGEGVFPESITRGVEVEGYSITTVESGDKLLYLIYSPSSLGLQYGIYKFLTLLGIRFFHPKDEYIPHYSTLMFPEGLKIISNPAVNLRGFHVHLLHPI